MWISTCFPIRAGAMRRARSPLWLRTSAATASPRAPAPSRLASCGWILRARSTGPAASPTTSTSSTASSRVPALTDFTLACTRLRRSGSPSWDPPPPAPPSPCGTRTTMGLRASVTLALLVAGRIRQLSSTAATCLAAVLGMMQTGIPRAAPTPMALSLVAAAPLLPRVPLLLRVPPTLLAVVVMVAVARRVVLARLPPPPPRAPRAPPMPPAARR